LKTLRVRRLTNRKSRIRTSCRTILLLCLPGLTQSFAFAGEGEGLFGTKTSPISATTTASGSGMGALQVAQMFVALLVVLAMLKWLMPTLIKRVGKGNTKSGVEIKIRESATMGPAQLYIVDVRGKSLLVGATANSVACIAELSAPQTPQLQTFQEMVDASPERSSFADTSIADALEQLNRLKQLGS
jgi:flagellar biogenesis protein FliO